MNRQTTSNIQQAKVGTSNNLLSKTERQPLMPRNGTHLPAGKKKVLSSLNPNNLDNRTSKPPLLKGQLKADLNKENAGAKVPFGIKAPSGKPLSTQHLAKPLQVTYGTERSKLPLPFKVYCEDPTIIAEKESVQPQNASNKYLEEVPQENQAFFLHSPLKKSPLSDQEKDREEEEIVVYDSPMVVDNSLENLCLKDEPPGNEFLIPEYAQDIYAYLKTVETKHRPRINYMRKQTDINSGMRRILVDWLVEVSLEYKLNEETLYLAVSYIDRFLSCMAVQRNKLQLVGTACMFIASKYEEIYPPDVSEFVYITDDTYSKMQVLRMEHLVLKVLSFDLAVPTASFFLQRFCSLCFIPDSVQSLAKYLCELSLLETDPFLRFLPSEIASASLALANYTFGKELWGSELRLVSGYIEEDFRSCLECLHALYKEATTYPQQAIQEKYRSNKFNCVSTINPPPALPPHVC